LLAHQAAYSTANLSAVVQYAYDRGVRVMPEFDVPGHGDWGAGIPDLMIEDGPCTDTLDPTNPDVYPFLASFLGEMGSARSSVAPWQAGRQR
jgi:hexosaminidase